MARHDRLRWHLRPPSELRQGMLSLLLLRCGRGEAAETRRAAAWIDADDGLLLLFEMHTRALA